MKTQTFINNILKKHKDGKYNTQAGPRILELDIKELVHEVSKVYQSETDDCWKELQFVEKLLQKMEGKCE